jgi:hypothetical protein
MNLLLMAAGNNTYPDMPVFSKSEMSLKVKGSGRIWIV